jgi:hypothetical protein
MIVQVISRGHAPVHLIRDGVLVAGVLLAKTQDGERQDTDNQDQDGDAQPEGPHEQVHLLAGDFACRVQHRARSVSDASAQQDS